MSKLNICFFTREYAHPRMGATGGIGVFLKRYLEHLSKQANVTVFSFGYNDLDFRDDTIRVVKVKDLSFLISSIQSRYLKLRLPGYITLKRLLASLNRRYIAKKLKRFLKQSNIQLLEFHDYGGDAAYLKTQLPYVTRCHGSCLTLHKFMGYHNRITDSIFEKKFFKQYTGNVVGVSKFAANTTQKAFGLAVEPKVIYNGVNLPKEVISNKTIEFSVFYFGSIRERKGIDLACKAFNSILEECPKASFHVLGNNNNDYWNTTAKLLLNPKALDRTTYYGVVLHKDVNRYLEKAHVVLFPSYGENFSMALLEVMALGKIVVTSNIPSFNEIIKHGVNGFIARNLESYSTIVQHVFDKTIDQKSISKSARQTIENEYTWEGILPQNIQLYQSIVNGK